MHLSVSELAGLLFCCTGHTHAFSKHQLPQGSPQLAVIAAGMLLNIRVASPLHASMQTSKLSHGMLPVVVLRQHATPSLKSIMHYIITEREMMQISHHVLQAKPELPVCSMQSLEGVAQARVPCMQLLLLVCCICILLRLHLHRTQNNVPHSPKPKCATPISAANLLHMINLRCQLTIPFLIKEPSTVTAWRALYLKQIQLAHAQHKA